MLLQDMGFFRDIYLKFWQSVPNTAWELRTGGRDKDWTLHQTLAHIVSIGDLFNLAINAALHGKILTVKGLKSRHDLPTFNHSEIMRLQQLSPPELINRLNAIFEFANQTASKISSKQAQQKSMLYVYNRPIPVQDYLDFHLSHMGVVHAAQVTRPLEQTPLWENYSDDFKSRQVKRFLKHFSVAYWQDYNDIDGAMNVRINGIGDWHLLMNQQGGELCDGLDNTAQYGIRFTHPNILFSVFTVAIPMRTALQMRAMQILDGEDTTLKMLRLFGATPPHS